MHYCSIAIQCSVTGLWEGFFTPQFSTTVNALFFEPDGTMNSYIYLYLPNSPLIQNDFFVKKPDFLKKTAKYQCSFAWFYYQNSSLAKLRKRDGPRQKTNLRTILNPSIGVSSMVEYWGSKLYLSPYKEFQAWQKIRNVHLFLWSFFETLSSSLVCKCSSFFMSYVNRMHKCQ